MGRVFVPEPRLLNEEKAAIHGNIVPLVPAEAKLGLEPDRLKATMAKALSTFDDDDYLLLDGSSVHCVVAISIIGIERNSIPLLIWGNRGGYLPRLINLDNVPSPIFHGLGKKVFVTNDVHEPPKVDATLVTLTSGNDPNIMEPDAIKEGMIKILVNSQPDDYLLLAGSKTHNSVAAAIFSKMHGKLNLMIWNASTCQYLLRSSKFTVEDLHRVLCTGI
jgi:hypothetical protein